MSKQDIRKMVDNCTRKVKYNPDIMWFDYQALFDKTRNKVLGKTDNIKVKHVDFNKNVIARKAVFDSDEIDTNMLNKALDGDLNSLGKIKENLYYYYRQDNDNDAYTNFLYFLTIQMALGTCYECNWNDYSSCSHNDFVPT